MRGRELATKLLRVKPHWIIDVVDENVTVALVMANEVIALDELDRLAKRERLSPDRLHEWVATQIALCSPPMPPTRLDRDEALRRRVCGKGFGEKAQRYADQLREYARNIAVLRYGFQFRKTNVTEETIRDSVDAVVTRTKRRVEDAEEPLSAVIQGVDDAWEVCLLKFTIDMIERSAGGNFGDLRKRGLI